MDFSVLVGELGVRGMVGGGRVLEPIPCGY